MTSSFFWASMKAVSASLVSMHLWSCVWYMIACDNVNDGGNCAANTWANTDNLDYGTGIYILSVCYIRVFYEKDDQKFMFSCIRVFGENSVSVCRH